MPPTTLIDLPNEILEMIIKNLVVLNKYAYFKDPVASRGCAIVRGNIVGWEWSSGGHRRSTLVIKGTERAVIHTGILTTCKKLAQIAVHMLCMENKFVFTSWAAFDTFFKHIDVRGLAASYPRIASMHRFDIILRKTEKDSWNKFVQGIQRKGYNLDVTPHPNSSKEGLGVEVVAVEGEP
jgi:hypothetical protein